jgi:poly(hydroxyalkanoate) depolymerase family esterase
MVMETHFPELSRYRGGCAPGGSSVGSMRTIIERAEPLRTSSEGLWPVLSNHHLLKNIWRLPGNRATVCVMSMRLRRYEFSERLAEILGESRRDLRFRVTLMITGGLVPPGPRGPGSPAATPDYAADLLIGVMAAPQQAHTVDAIRCYRELRPTAFAADANGPGVVVGPPALRPAADPPELPMFEGRPRFGEVLARLLEQASDTETRPALARELFGVWLSRGFPVAAVQLAAWSKGRRAILTQRYELPEGARPPAWLDPGRGGAADPGLFHSVFLPVGKLIAIGALTTPRNERKSLVLGQTIAGLAALARHRGNRRPWEKFLSLAAEAEATAERMDARRSRLVEVTGFGANPGNLRMLAYVPDTLLEPRGLVVVLHGCTQTAASYEFGTGWSTLADRHGFALLLPEQNRSNNPLRCFNWFRTEDNGRDAGEALSIRQMVARMIAEHGIDPGRVFVTGLSAGAAMTSVMLATYPDVFAGGAIIAGVPYRSADGLQDAFDVIFQGRSREAREWGDLVRAASPHRGPWPKVSVWHGAADATVKPLNAGEIVKQWTDVHGLAPAPAFETMVDGYPRRVWRDADDRDLIEFYSITAMAHGAPIAPRAVEGCGNTAPFIHDVGISSTHHIARFWGLTERRVAVSTAPRRPAAGATQPRSAPAEEPAVAARDVAGAVILVDGAGRARAGESRSDQNSKQQRRSYERAGRAEADPTSGVDVQAILAKSFELAGIAAGTAGGLGKGGVGGVDVPAILAKSFELAGLVAKPRQTPAERSAEPSPARTEPPTIDGEATAAPDVSSEAAAPASATRTPATEVAASSGGLTASGWEADGWKLAADDSAVARGTVLFGYASSGVGGDVGDKIRSVKRRMTLGWNPKLNYLRKLDLNATANILTSARFTVLVDGVPVDEVSAVGMDYAEAEWTERTDVDLSAFAGRTVTLSFEVAANSNVCIEVFAKAWLRGVTVRDAIETAA